MSRYVIILFLFSLFLHKSFSYHVSVLSNRLNKSPRLSLIPKRFRDYSFEEIGRLNTPLIPREEQSSEDVDSNAGRTSSIDGKFVTSILIGDIFLLSGVFLAGFLNIYMYLGNFVLYIVNDFATS